MKKPGLINCAVLAGFFALVFLVEFFLRKYSLVWASNMSLFLFSPDWFHVVFAKPFPVFHVVKSFLLQYFGLHPLGPVVVAAVLTLILLAFRLIPLFRRPKAFAMLAAVASIVVLISALLPSSREAERRSKVLVSTRNRDWNAVLAALPPSRPTSDLMSFAMLALQQKGQLCDRMFEYPVKTMSDLDYFGTDDIVGSFFEAMLAENLGLQNEAVHRIFQMNCSCPYGNSFLGLNLLVRNNLALGNMAMVRKYAEVLSLSPRFKGEARRLLALCDKAASEASAQPTNAAQPGAYVPPASSADAPVVDHNPLVLLMSLQSAGKYSRAAGERFMAYQLLDQASGFQGFTPGAGRFSQSPN